MSRPPLQHSPQTRKFLVTHESNVQGPFETEFIEAMIMARVYPGSVLVQEIGTTDWVPFSSISDLAPSQDHHQPKNAQNSCPPLPTNARGMNNGKKKSDTVIGWVMGTFVVLATIWVVSQVIWSKPATKTKTNLSQYQAPTKPPAYSSRPTPAPTQSSYKPKTYPAALQPQEATQIYRDATGRTYSVPNSAYYRLVSLQSALIVKKTSLDQEEFRHESLSRKIDSERLYLDQTSQSAVDTFNRKINQLNALNSKVQSMVDDYNQDVDSFNAELERVGTPTN